MTSVIGWRLIITQAQGTFETIWDTAETGLYVAEQKDNNAYVVCRALT